MFPSAPVKPEVTDGWSPGQNQTTEAHIRTLQYFKNTLFG